MLIATATTLGGVVLTAPSVAASTKNATKTVNISTVVLSKTLYGLVVARPGHDNGSFLVSDLKYLPGYFPGERTLAGEMTSGAAKAYFRSWNSVGPAGDTVVILALDFRSKSQASNFVSVETSSLRSLELNEFLVPHMSPIEGFEYLPAQSHIGATVYVVDFSKGTFVFDIGLVNGLGDLAFADAATLANSQASKVS